MPNRKQRRAAARAAGTLVPKRMLIHTPKPPAEAAQAPTVTIADIPEPGHPFPSLESMTPSISPAQLAANQANAQLSTGPTSDAGKAISSMNRLSHGLTRHNGRFNILCDEDPAAYEELKRRLLEEHQPTTETEFLLVTDMAESRWLKERAQRLQAGVMCVEDGAVRDAKMFALYVRYETTHHNNFYKALNQLLKLRAERRKAENGFEAQRIKTEAHEMKKATHYWDVLHKDAQTCHQIGANTMQQLDGLDKNRDFEKLYEAELAKFGLKQGGMSAAKAA